ncbi:hypothetical protein CCH79_00020064, partial [Gambusia affinis]
MDQTTDPSGFSKALLTAFASFKAWKWVKRSLVFIFPTAAHVPKRFMSDKAKTGSFPFLEKLIFPTAASDPEQLWTLIGSHRCQHAAVGGACCHWTCPLSAGLNRSEGTEASKPGFGGFVWSGTGSDRCSAGGTRPLPVRNTVLFAPLAACSEPPLSVPDLLLCLESSELQELERVRTAINQQLSSDRGGAVLSSLVERYLDSSSSQVLLLLSSIREPHHKVLLEKLNEALTRPGSRAAAIALLGHLIRKQPPWIHHISQAPVLPTLLRCLKTDGDVAVLVSGVLVLVALLPMIPQAGKQHIYDFFDVFGRLASRSYRNPGQVSAAHLVHLHAAVYSLFHRLYGMFPCNFVSYLRLHYGMKENQDTFQELVKPMLEHVRIHPELVTGTQDSELDPSRWRSCEVHDIIMECCRLSLDPLEDACCPAPSPHLDLSPAPQVWQPIGSSGSSVGQLTLSPSHIQVTHTQPSHLGQNRSASSRLWYQQKDPVLLGTRTTSMLLHLCVQADDVTWSPSSQCGLATPPPELASPGPAPSLSRCTSISAGSASRGHTLHQEEDAGEPSWWRAVSSVLQETLASAAGQQQQVEEERSTMSPLKVLEQMIIHGSDAHERLGRRSSAGSRSDRSHLGGKKQSMKSKGTQPSGSSPAPPAAPVKLVRFLCPAPQGEELQRSQLLLVHSRLQYERFKRQQHAIRNRRLLRRVINATALEEQAVAMKAQLGVQDQEIRSLRSSLSEEQRRLNQLQQDGRTQTDHLLDQNQQLLLQQQRHQQDNQQLQSDLEDCHGRLRELEAELQGANRRAKHAEHQLTQLGLK